MHTHDSTFLFVRGKIRIPVNNVENNENRGEEKDGAVVYVVRGEGLPALVPAHPRLVQ